MSNVKTVKHRKDLQDLRFTVVAEVKEDLNEAYHVDYVVYNACYFDDDTPIQWRHKDNWNDITDTLENAEIFLHGSVKWDGCSNWWFDIEEQIALHCCERWELTRVGEVLAFCYDWTKELLPNFND